MCEITYEFFTKIFTNFFVHCYCFTGVYRVFFLEGGKMATLSDIGVAAGLNILSAFIFFVAFAILRLQPFNDRVYFPKWYLKGLRTDPVHGGAFVRKFVNLDWRSYLRFLNWMPAALRMPEPELIDHAGLDSVVYLRIYLIGYEL